MEEISLGVPEPILDSLPDREGDTAKDMRRHVASIETHVNQIISDAADESASADEIVDVIERLENQMERYDEFIPELRAWGQSPIYTIAWRNLQADLIMQLYDVDWLATELDRTRNYRLVENGIRFPTE